MNEAFYHFSDVRPHVCAHDSSVGSLSVLSNRPKVVKLHGDYLYDDIKNTLRETESLENNTKEKFIEFSKDYGLILVGYSGQDRSVMDVLSYLVQQEEYFKNGVYWCFRDDDEINHEVRKLLWKDKVYCVRIDGFDQLFAELNNELELNLKQFTERNSLKIDKCIQSIIKDDFGLKNNEIIRKDLIKLREKSNNQDISELISKLNESDNSKSLSSIDFKRILEIESLIVSLNFNKALSRIDEFLLESKFDINNSQFSKIQESLYFMKIKCFKKMDKIEYAHQLIDDLIINDKFNLNYHHKKILIIEDKEEKIKYLQKIRDDFPYSIAIINDICINYAILYRKNKKESTNINVDSCINYIDTSLSIDSSLDNIAYEIKYDLLNIKKELLKKKGGANNEKNIEKINIDINDLIKKVMDLNPLHRNSLDIYFKNLKKKESIKDFDKKIKLIFDLIDKSSNEKVKYIIKKIGIIFITDDYLECYQSDLILKKIIDDFFENNKYSNYIDFLYYKVRFLQSKTRDANLIKEVIKKCLKHNRISEVAVKLSEFLSFHDYNNEVIDLEIIMSNYLDELNPFESSEFSKYISYSKYGPLSDQFIDYIENSKNLCEDMEDHITTYTYDLLMANKYHKLIEFVDESSKIIENLLDHEKAIISINYITAYKMINGNITAEHNEILDSFISRSIDQSVTICCKSLKNNDDSQALSNMKSMINLDYSNYYSFVRWPAINENLKHQIRLYFENQLQMQKVS